MRKVLVVAPHLDDETYACGATIAKVVEQGGKVYVLGIYGRVYDYGRTKVKDTLSRQLEHHYKALEVLGAKSVGVCNLLEGEPHTVGHYAVLEPIEKALLEVQPTEVIIPSLGDTNQDHKMLHNICMIALRATNLGTVRRVLAAYSFDTKARNPTHYEAHTLTHLASKLAASYVYKDEVRDGTHPRAERSIRANHIVWGSACGECYAEAFDIIFQKEDK